MHWVLDMTFREDESRIRKKQGPLVLYVMRKIAMALFKRDETKSASMALAFSHLLRQTFRLFINSKLNASVDNKLP
ncbi:MAG: hypothetical protein ACI9U5_001019 [Colwellia sp.]|jgi:hypothetical protein